MAKASSIDEAWHWNITRLADGFKMDRGTVRKRLKDAGVKPAGQKGSANVYWLHEAAAALFAPPPSDADAEQIDPESMDPTKRKHWYEGEDTRTDLKVKKGFLIPVEDVREDRARLMKLLVGFAEGALDKMERTRLFDAEQLDQLEQQFDGLRAELFAEMKGWDE